MKTILKSVAAASLMLAAAQPAIVQAQASGPLVPGLAVADLDGVIANSSAYKTAQSQRPVTYKAQFDQAEARRKAITAQLQPLVEKFNKDRAAPNPNTAALQQQAQQIQQIQQAGEQELRTILQPVALSEAYVQEQISEKLDAAVKAAMAKKKVSLLLSPQAVTAFNNNAYNITQDVANELNTLIPSATLVPPAGWEPREMREARAQQQAQQGQQPTTTATQPSGR